MWPRSASSPSETSHIAVAPATAAATPAGYGGCGQQCNATRSSNPDSPACRAAIPAAERPSVPATATTSPIRAPDRSTGTPSLQVAECGDGDHDLGTLHQVAADDLGTAARRLPPHPLVQRIERRERRVGRAAERDDVTLRTRPHRGDVGAVLRDRLAADLLRRRPVGAEVPALHQHVGGHHHPGVGHRDDGGVVPRPDEHRRPGLAAGGDPVDHRELAQRGDRLRTVVWLLGDDPSSKSSRYGTAPRLR